MDSKFLCEGVGWVWEAFHVHVYRHTKMRKAFGTYMYDMGFESFELLGNLGTYMYDMGFESFELLGNLPSFKEQNSVHSPLFTSSTCRSVIFTLLIDPMLFFAKLVQIYLISVLH